MVICQIDCAIPESENRANLASTGSHDLTLAMPFDFSRLLGIGFELCPRSPVRGPGSRVPFNPDFERLGGKKSGNWTKAELGRNEQGLGWASAIASPTSTIRRSRFKNFRHLGLQVATTFGVPAGGRSRSGIVRPRRWRSSCCSRSGRTTQRSFISRAEPSASGNTISAD